MVPVKKAMRLDCSMSRCQCSVKISCERQNKLCDEYWGLSDAVRQKSYICALVTEVPIQRSRKRQEESTKSKNENKENQCICLKFGCATFNISFQIVFFALSSMVKGRPAPSATSEERIKLFKEHIDFFPRVESNYSHHYLFQLPVSITHVISLSDTRGGQNRNQFIDIAILYAVNKLSHLKIINMKIMESGHSYLEADSIHATTERARKHKQLHTTREWALLVEMTIRKSCSYKVKTLKYSDLTKGGEPVKLLNIKWLSYNEDKPFTIQFKYELSDDNFMEFDVSEDWM
ncbi:hypothetical protein PR048_009683 [Dryococelus australis]|uniref:Uncharacterized protein n=1 Tax=Dryococelus australis TaxID=614101 RepID=A0ABQ9I0K0_9NEOP|nr:hypothetical protein PR048_009683 [Dryococelus australis]